MIKFRILFASIFSVMIIASSCDIINPPENIPTYIRIDTFKVEVHDFDEGSASHYITNCYISAGGANLGVFEMPFTIPCLETGLQTLTIRPGIKLNGIAASRIDYPFFKPYIIDYELHKGEIHLIEPVTTYKENCLFPWMEDFEDAGISMLYASYSTVQIVNQNVVLKEGRNTGAIFLNKEDSIFEAYSSEWFELPQNSSPILLEFDYKNNNGFEIGMYIFEDGVAEWSGLVYINPSEIWKRFYVDIGQTVNRNLKAELFRMGIRAFIEPENTESAKIYLDNIKLIHFK